MIHSRREFLGLVVGTAACAATPLLFADAPSADDKLDQLCWCIGEFVRDHNIKPSRVLAIDEVGRLVIVAGVNMETDRVFHIADREQKYTRLGYRVEDRFLDRARELSVIAHVVNETVPYRFPVMFK